jgi:hypothetical protein
MDEAEAFYDQLRDYALADAERMMRDDDTDDDLAAQVLEAHRAAWEEGRHRHLDQARKDIEAVARGEKRGGTMRRATHAALTPAT